MKLILLESYEADLSNSGYNIQFGEELTDTDQSLQCLQTFRHFFGTLYDLKITKK